MPPSTVSFKRKTGRPRVGATLVGVSLIPERLALLEEWIADQPSPKPTRPEAIRRLIELGLAAAKNVGTD